MHAADLERLAAGADPEPHAFLGAHELGRETAVRAVRHLAESVSVLDEAGDSHVAEHLGHGVWQALLPARPKSYRVLTVYSDGSTWDADDPYRFTPAVGELALHLWREGRLEEAWNELGARVLEHEGVAGTRFTVWAPNAHAVRVKGSFNDWNGVLHPMRTMGSSGVWELFVPAVAAGTLYKFELLTDEGWTDRADPFARRTEVPPSTASVVDESAHEWGDDEWMRGRAATNPHESAMSVYEVHLGSWREGLGYATIADELIAHLDETGFTHVEFMPLAEHPYGPSWGYQVTGYYAPTARWGSPDELKELIDRLHRAGYGVLLDWVPAHFPKDAWALARFDGTHLFEHPDPNRGEHPDWGTLIFDYGRREVRNFLVANALYWLEEFHIDGLRVDAVASMLYLDYSREDGQWTPNQHGGRENLEAIDFLKEATATAYRRNPGSIMIAEESTSFPGVTHPTSGGGLGFGAKWNMGWMHDSLQYMERDPMHRSHHHGEITFSFLYAFSENYMLPISHDEVVHGKGSLVSKMPGDHWQKLANTRGYLTFMWAHPGKQLLFMGQEFGQMSEWSEARGLDWWMLDQPSHAGLQRLVASLNRIYRDTPALWARDNDPGGFSWIDGGNVSDSLIAFIRHDHDGGSVACVHNFSGVPIEGYRLRLPHAGTWLELLNSDAEEFGGSGVGNLGRVEAIEGDHGAVATIRVPPFGGLMLKPAAPADQ
ncbi:1,4-alpha-glucan branching protein GlgB [Agrococcus casei]|uniref:1,4-alpha-glucan branching protein GlgB n=1 Tax=Agrococcus casei TaxID=343512 RepID=UPI003F8DFC6C